MTISDNDSLLSYIAVRHTVGLEDVATDALSFILNRSDSAKAAISEFLGDADAPLSIAKAETQSFLVASGTYPDMALHDSDDNLLAYVESKFWAPLTHNQPVTYWENLPTDKRSVLLFLAPQYRVDEPYLWDELIRRLRDAGHELGAKDEGNGRMMAAEVNGNRRLMLASWEHVLGLMAERVGRDGDEQAAYEMSELRGLASAAIEGKRDTSNDEFKLLLAEAVATLRESGWANTEGLTVGQGFGFYGRYLRLAGVNVWLGTVDEVAKQAPDKQLWLSFYDGASKDRLNEVREKLGSRAESPPGLLGWMRLAIPVPFRQDAGWQVSLNDIVSELESIAKLIDADGPTYW